jgi:hypothetical protein
MPDPLSAFIGRSNVRIRGCRRYKAGFSPNDHSHLPLRAPSTHDPHRHHEVIAAPPFGIVARVPHRRATGVYFTRQRPTCRARQGPLRQPLSVMAVTMAMPGLGAGDFTVHGMRSAARSWMADNDFEFELAEALPRARGRQQGVWGVRALTCPHRAVLDMKSISTVSTNRGSVTATSSMSVGSGFLTKQ